MTRAKQKACVACGIVAAHTDRADVRIQSGRLELAWRGRLCELCAQQAENDPLSVVQRLIERAPGHRRDVEGER